MMIRKTSMMAAIAGASAVCATAGAGEILYSDAPSFSAGLVDTHVETFDTMSPGAFSILTFGGAMTAPVSSGGTQENSILSGSDGFGAVAALGGGNFWKLRAGSASIDFGSTWNAFGFWYSDLEGASIQVSLPDLGYSTTLSDHNPGANTFFGVRSDQPFSSVTIAWVGNSGDGVGFDSMTVGRDVPSAGPSALAGIAFVSVVGTRRRGKRQGRIARVAAA